MAYSDYDAFVYKDGSRRRDRENVSIYQEGCDLPSGMRIFVHIVENMTDGGMPSERHEDCFHAVLGDGSVRVGCYKTGIGSIFSLDESTGK